MNFAPIIIFVYNRLRHLSQTIEALQKNLLAKESELYIYSDAPKNNEDWDKVNEVRNYIKKINGFKKITVIERTKNFGLANSVINGVTEIINKFEKAIILEDDMITSSYFLKYMNDALEFYKENETVISIHGYLYPIKQKLYEPFFLKGADCWGWATWKRGWNLFEHDGNKLLKELKKKNLTSEFDYDNSYPFTKMLKGQISGQNDSWAVRWYASAFLKNKFTLYPNESLVKNIGNDSTGHHLSNVNFYDVSITNNLITKFPITVVENIEVKALIKKYFNSNITYSIFQKILNLLK